MLLRHRFVWLDPGLAAGSGDAEETALIETWLKAGHPAIVRRSEIELRDYIALGIALPTRLGRRRIALQVPEQAVVKQAMPPRLADALICAPAEWQHGLQEIANDLAHLGADVHVYGSLGWQYLTGEIYLRPQSDIDLLIVPRENCDADSVLAAFAHYAQVETPRLDGEMIIGSDRAVAWRELLMPSENILVRSRVRLALEPHADVLARFRQKAAA
jgi:phosphoribosyl-dephospho-CoA transferase